MGEVRKTKELDHYLKRIILKVPDKIQQFIDNAEKTIFDFSIKYDKTQCKYQQDCNYPKCQGR